MKRALERADGSRPVLAHTGPPSRARDLAGLAAKFPRFVRFVPDLGAVSLPCTEEHQASVIRTEVEILRRLKYRPTGGFCQDLLADPRPVVSASVLDHRRLPKLAYEALAAACAPVIVVADPPDASYRPGARVHLDVHVVSDLRFALQDVRVTAALLGPAGVSGPTSWEWVGDLGADTCVRLGAVSFEAPPGPASLVLQLDLEHEGAKAARRYEVTVGAK